MKINLLILSFCVFLVNSLYAQYDEDKAREIIEKTVNKYKDQGCCVIKLNYILQNRSTGEDHEEKADLYLKDGKFKLVMQEQVIFSDQKKVWNYLKEDVSMTITWYDPNELELNPTEIFTMWETGFLYGYAGDMLVDGKNAHLIELTPEDKEKPYFKVKLFIDINTKELIKTQTFYKNNTLVMTFEFQDVDTQQDIDDSNFIFRKSDYPDNLEIIDLTE